MNKRIVGLKGEDIAAKYLEKHKYKIIERNFACRFGEIDIIAKDGKFIVFIEVKRRKSLKFGRPCEAVDLKKQQTIVTCATYYLSMKALVGKPVRFDVVEILGEEVNLIKDAFRPQ
ncbi:MAG: YraN family protein [Clostridia bacterium]|nr:YraN family protein [Clostridia bacterium]